MTMFLGSDANVHGLSHGDAGVWIELSAVPFRNCQPSELHGFSNVYEVLVGKDVEECGCVFRDHLWRQDSDVNELPKVDVAKRKAMTISAYAALRALVQRDRLRDHRIGLFQCWNVADVRREPRFQELAVDEICPGSFLFERADGSETGVVYQVGSVQ